VFDTGAIHWAAFDQASAGYVFRHNFIHHVGYKSASLCSTLTSCMLTGIYMDDGSFGTTVYGNVFWMQQPSRTPTPDMGDEWWFSDSITVIAMFENWGSGNFISNNLVVDSQHVLGSSGGFINSDGETGASQNQIPSDSDFWANMGEYKWKKAVQEEVVVRSRVVE